MLNSYFFPVIKSLIDAFLVSQINPDRLLEIHADQCIQSMCLFLCDITCLSNPGYAVVKILI